MSWSRTKNIIMLWPMRDLSLRIIEFIEYDFSLLEGNSFEMSTVCLAYDNQGLGWFVCHQLERNIIFVHRPFCIHGFLHCISFVLWFLLPWIYDYMNTNIHIMHTIHLLFVCVCYSRHWAEGRCMCMCACVCARAYVCMCASVCACMRTCMCRT